jgi:hypothetical protein
MNARRFPPQVSGPIPHEHITTTDRRFPPPWSVEEVAHQRTRRGVIAVNIARLPELLQKT